MRYYNRTLRRSGWKRHWPILAPVAAVLAVAGVYIAPGTNAATTPGARTTAPFVRTPPSVPGAARSTTTVAPKSVVLPKTTTSPGAPASTCHQLKDASASLQSWINSAPANSTLTFPKGDCWDVLSPLTIRSTNHLTINGNGSSFYDSVSSMDSYSPVLQLYLNSHLTIENLNIHGALDAAQDNGTEGHYGAVLEGNDGVDLNGIHMNDIQGDFVYLAPPNDISNVTDALNKHVRIYGSTFTNGGYHGLSIESVAGMTVDHDTFTNIAVDAIDFEYDDFSTGINPDGSAFWAAQDDITIENSKWTNWSDDWFVSDQGQTPGVQQQHVALLNNTLNGGGPVIEIVGTPTGAIDPTTGKTVSSKYLNLYLTIKGNTMTPPNNQTGYRGGGSAAMSIYSVAYLDMENNNLPYCPNDDYPACDGTPGQYEMELFNGTFDTIKNNTFSGAVGVVQPMDFPLFNTGATICGNKIGTHGTQIDKPCS